MAAALQETNVFVQKSTQQTSEAVDADFGTLGLDAPDFQNLPLTAVEPAPKVGPDALLVEGFQIGLEAAVAID
jgi:hypothetical protein